MSRYEVLVNDRKVYGSDQAASAKEMALVYKRDQPDAWVQVNGPQANYVVEYAAVQNEDRKEGGLDDNDERGQLLGAVTVHDDVVWLEEL